MTQFRVLLIKEGKWWIAQGVDVNIAVQALTYHEAKDKFIQNLIQSVTTMISLGIEWQDQLFSTTPERYIEMYNDADPFGLHIDQKAKELLHKSGIAVEESEFRIYEKVPA